MNAPQPMRSSEEKHGCAPKTKTNKHPQHPWPRQGNRPPEPHPASGLASRAPGKRVIPRAASSERGPPPPVRALDGTTRAAHPRSRDRKSPAAPCPSARLPPRSTWSPTRAHARLIPLQPRLRPSTPLSPPPTLLLSLPAFPGGGADGDSESPPSSSPPHPYQPPVAFRIPTRSCGCHRIRSGNAVAYILPRGETREAVTGPPEPIVWSGLGRKSRRACPPRVCR